MEMADISVQELAYEAGVPNTTVYQCRNKDGRYAVSDGIWSILFHVIEEWAPGTQRMLAAAEEAMNDPCSD